MVAIAVCCVLVVSEVWAYVVPSYREHLVVDPIIEDRLRINFDITFHALPCSDANIDAMDVAGEQQNGLDHDIAKTRLSAQGVPIGDAFAHRLEDARAVAAASSTPLPPNYCGSCYGAESREGQCCNTCDEVRSAYAERGWAMSAVTLECEQCQREKRYPAVESKEGEGCRLTGFMRVNKVAGNFHIAMGETHSRGTNHIHQFNPHQLGHFNVSHTIHGLSFGEPFPGRKNPLDGVTRSVPEGTGVWMHYIKVVPTVFSSSGPAALSLLTPPRTKAGAPSSSPPPSPSSAGSGALLSTNQYSVSSQYRVAMAPGGRMTALPGVFFVYDISPYMVTVTKHRASFTHLLTSLFAIMGGVLTLASAIDSLLYHVTNAAKRGGLTQLAAAATAAVAGDKAAGALGLTAQSSSRGSALGGSAAAFAQPGATSFASHAVSGGHAVSPPVHAPAQAPALSHPLTSGGASPAGFATAPDSWGHSGAYSRLTAVAPGVVPAGVGLSAGGGTSTVPVPVPVPLGMGIGGRMGGLGGALGARGGPPHAGKDA